MARIRSIKPEFWSDGKIRRLSDTSALFFISLWTHADDFGFFSWDTLELSMKVCRWRSQDIMRMLRALHGAGMVRLSQGHGVGKIEGWNHQKIKDRRASKWNDVEIVWDEPKINAHGSDEKPPRIGVDRIGEDRRGSTLNRIRSDIGSAVETPTEKALPKTKPQAVTKGVWDAYSDAYWDRWGNAPADNAKIRSLMKHFITQVGVEDAPAIARAYVSRNDSLYVNARHDFSLCLRDCQKIRTDWMSGNQMTLIEARQIEGKQAHMNVFDQVMAMQAEKAKEQGHG